MSKRKLFWQCVGACTLAASLYGIVHDQFTIRICPEYFTVWHPQLYEGEDKNLTLLAICWGVIASWWVGALLGIFLGLCATAGKWPLSTFHAVRKSIVAILIASAICAIAAGLFEWRFAIPIYGFYDSDRVSTLPLDVQNRFLIDLFIHNGSYDGAPVAAFICGLLILRQRKRESRSLELKQDRNGTDAAC